MNRRGWLVIACVFAGIVSGSVHAFLYEIKVLRKWDDVCKRHVYFIGCSDFHDKAHAANAQQRVMIEQLLAKYDPITTKILVEDLSSPNCQGKLSCGPFYINSKEGILAGLHNYCKGKSMDCLNVEYRYCRVATMGPVINNLSVSPYMFPSTRTMKVGSLLDEIEGIIADLGSCTSNEHLKKVYHEDVKKIRAIFTALKLTAHRDASIADYLHASSTPKNRLDVLKHLLTFDSSLLDIKMAHLVAHATHKQKIIAFAGGTHINRVCDILKKMGYQQVASSATPYKKEHDISKCLGSNIVEGAFCVKPEPLPLATIEKQLNYQ